MFTKKDETRTRTGEKRGVLVSPNRACMNGYVGPWPWLWELLRGVVVARHGGERRIRTLARRSVERQVCEVR